MSNELIPYNDIVQMANVMVESNMFGFKTPAQAIAIMLIAQAEGMHPAIAARDYHVIEGKPSLKADAMLARFQKAGGVIKWTHYSDTKCAAIFSHPIQCPQPIVVEWDIERAKTAEVYKLKTSKGFTGMWVKYPRQMLKSRVISEGVRATLASATNSMYTPEEVIDMVEGNGAIPIDCKVESVNLPIQTKQLPGGIPSVNIPAQNPVPGGIKTYTPNKIEKVEIIDGITPSKKVMENGIEKEVSGRPWKKYGITIAGVIYGTFSDTIGATAQSLFESGGDFDFSFEEKGKYKNITELTPIVEPTMDESTMDDDFVSRL